MSLRRSGLLSLLHLGICSGWINNYLVMQFTRREIFLGLTTPNRSGFIIMKFSFRMECSVTFRLISSYVPLAHERRGPLWDYMYRNIPNIRKI
jgi:hypothetical protein